jgi:hypothetical protein
MSSALYTGIIHAPTPGNPKNLSIFFIPKKLATTMANISQHLITQSLKSTEGQGLDTSEIKLATKQKISIPANYHDLLAQTENFLLLLEFLFGNTSILFLQFQKVATQLKNYEHEYDDRIQSQQRFIAKLLSFINHRIQLFPESCSTAPTAPNISFHHIIFDTLLQSMIDGTFTMMLPTTTPNALPQQDEKPTTPSGGPFSVLMDQLQAYSCSQDAFSTSTPVVTVHLVQDLQNFTFVGETLDDIKSGLQPFIVADGSAEHHHANLELSRTYGLLALGEQSLLLTDLETLKAKEVQSIPLTYFELEHNLGMFSNLSGPALGTTHTITTAYKAFWNLLSDGWNYSKLLTTKDM